MVWWMFGEVGVLCGECLCGGCCTIQVTNHKTKSKKYNLHQLDAFSSLLLNQFWEYQNVLFVFLFVPFIMFISINNYLGASISICVTHESFCKELLVTRVQRPRPVKSLVSETGGMI